MVEQDEDGCEGKERGREHMSHPMDNQCNSLFGDFTAP